MTDDLNARQRAFIEEMRSSPEAEADGFDILAKREDGPSFFRALGDAGFFESSRFPGVIRLANNSFRMAGWPAAEYLLSVAKRTSERYPFAAEIVSHVVRITREASGEEDKRDNYYLWHLFAETLSALPPEQITAEAIEVVPLWLESKFDRGFVGSMLGDTLIPRLLEREVDGAPLALKLLEYMSALRPNVDASGDPATVVEGFWYKNAITKNLERLAKQLPAETSMLFAKRAEETFALTGVPSWVHRPAIEAHEQNHDWEDSYNVPVDAFRDALSIWCELDVRKAATFIGRLYAQGAEISKRVAVHSYRVHFGALGSEIDIVDDDLLHENLTHEAFHLLRDRFSEFTSAQKDVILKALGLDETLPDSLSEDRPERYIWRRRQAWLAAIGNAGPEGVESRRIALDKLIGKLGDHPDFLAHWETSWGPGPSKYSKAKITQLLLAGTLISHLNGFQQTNDWEGETTSALATELTDAVKDRPQEFLDALHDFLSAKRAYQYAYLNAYKQLWEKNDPTQEDFWRDAWPRLLGWVHQILLQPTFWSEDSKSEGSMAPNRDWLPPLFADFVRAGVRSDDHAFEAEHLPLASKVLFELLTKQPPAALTLDRDPVTQTINNPRGKALEALISFALRSARLSDKALGNHTDTWTAIVPYFDHEIELIAQSGNDEFVVLFGMFLPQMQYLGATWYETPLGVICASERTRRLFGAGFVHASSSRKIYSVVERAGYLDAALAEETQERVRERVLERIALAYLWGDEALDGARISAVFAGETAADDLSEFSEFFWRVHKQPLEDGQREMVRAFWRKTVDWAMATPEGKDELGASLARLLLYFSSVEASDEERFIWVAARANVSHAGWFFSAELERLASISPGAVAKALVPFAKTLGYPHDHDDHIHNATKTVFDAGWEDEAIDVVETLRALPKFQALYRVMRPGIA